MNLNLHLAKKREELLKQGRDVHMNKMKYYEKKMKRAQTTQQHYSFILLTIFLRYFITRFIFYGIKCRLYLLDFCLLMVIFIGLVAICKELLFILNELRRYFIWIYVALVVTFNYATSLCQKLRKTFKSSTMETTTNINELFITES